MIKSAFDFFWNFGRPKLKKRLQYRFTDVVSGKPIYLWEAKDGTYWLCEADGRGLRVQTNYGVL